MPTIDFKPFLKGNFDDRQAVTRSIDRAYTEIGFFAITDHGVPEMKISKLGAKAMTFFGRG